MGATGKPQTKRKATNARAVKEATVTYAARNGAGRKSTLKRREIGEHLVIDPEICHGEMTFKGTRVPVENVLVYIAKGESIDGMTKHYPEVSRAAMREAVRLASDALLTHYGAARATVT